MTINIADYMARAYPSPPCWALVADVVTTEQGRSHAQLLEYRTVNNSVRSIANAFRLALHKGQHGYAQVPAGTAPQDFAVVLMGKSASLGLHHCGVWVGGKVLHALDGGTLHQDLPSLQAEYALLEFWERP
jgi:hypothetical protein